MAKNQVSISCSHRKHYVGKRIKNFQACLLMAEIYLYFSPVPEVGVQAQVKVRTLIFLAGRPFPTEKNDTIFFIHSCAIVNKVQYQSSWATQSSYSHLPCAIKSKVSLNSFREIQKEILTLEKHCRETALNQLKV